jgi:hypothetical protein
MDISQAQRLCSLLISGVKAIKGGPFRVAKSSDRLAQS